MRRIKKALESENIKTSMFGVQKKFHKCGLGSKGNIKTLTISL